MPPLYPGAYDALTNPAPGTDTVATSHSGLHGQVNDIIEAIEAFVGRSGTAFPASPAVGERFRRTDRNIDYYWDGTRWLSTQIFVQPFGGARAVMPVSAETYHAAPLWTDDYSQYLLDLRISAHVVATNNGTNRWEFTLYTVDGTVFGSPLANPNTGSMGADQWFRLKTVVNAVIGATIDNLELRAAKAGAPGNLYFTAMFTYRLIG